MIPVPLLLATAVGLAIAAGLRRLEHLLVSNRSPIWQSLLLLAALDALAPAIHGDTWALVVVAVGVDAAFHLVATAAWRPRRRDHHRQRDDDTLPDNVIALRVAKGDAQRS